MFLFELVPFGNGKGFEICDFPNWLLKSKGMRSLQVSIKFGHFIEVF